jgi:hypothetical protein
LGDKIVCFKFFDIKQRSNDNDNTLKECAAKGVWLYFTTQAHHCLTVGKEQRKLFGTFQVWGLDIQKPEAQSSALWSDILYTRNLKLT